jgi:ligand-binding sensor domain-containing protein
MLTTNDGLSANNVHAIAEDHAGDLWIGTELGGLNRLHAGHFTSFRQSDGFPSDNISSLYVDARTCFGLGPWATD